MLTLNFSTTTQINLSLEIFHNNGLSRDETKKIIESTDDYGVSGYNSSKVYCTASGFNGNWIVHTSATKPQDIQALVLEIEWSLQSALREKKTPMRLAS